MKILVSDQQVMEAALQMRSMRAQILAGNIANVDTPGYIGRDIDFDRALAEQLTTADRSQPDAAVTAEASLRPDSNNIDLNEQLAKSYQNSLDYVATLKLYSDSVSRIREATSTS